MDGSVSQPENIWPDAADIDRIVERFDDGCQEPRRFIVKRELLRGPQGPWRWQPRVYTLECGHKITTILNSAQRILRCSQCATLLWRLTPQGLHYLVDRDVRPGAEAYIK